jgi:hypothetical protein
MANKQQRRQQIHEAMIAQDPQYNLDSKETAFLKAKGVNIHDMARRGLITITDSDKALEGCNHFVFVDSPQELQTYYTIAAKCGIKAQYLKFI